MTEGLAQLEAAHQRWPEDIGAALALADAYRDAGRPADAGHVYADALRLDPERTEASFGAGCALAEVGRPDAALPLLAQATHARPRIWEYWIKLALALEALLKLPEALEALNHAAALDPEREETALHQLRVRFMLGQMRPVLAMTEAMTDEMANRHPEVRITRANALLALCRLDEAGQVAERAVSIFPDSPDTLATAAAIAGLREDRRTAALHCRRALAVEPRHYPSLVCLGNVSLGDAKPAEARTWFERALHVDEDRYEAYVGMAAAALAEDDREEAARWLEQGLQHAPWQNAALAALGLIEGAGGQAAAAEKDLRAVLTGNPLDYPSRLELTIVLMRGRRFAEARDILRPVLEQRDPALARQARGLYDLLSPPGRRPAPEGGR